MHYKLSATSRLLQTTFITTSTISHQNAISLIFSVFYYKTITSKYQKKYLIIVALFGYIAYICRKIE